MAFPTVIGTPVTDGMSSGTTNFDINLPSGIVAGELLLVFASFSNSTDRTDPTGWTRIGSSLTVRATYVWVRIATADANDACVVSRSGSAASCASCAYRVTDWIGTLSGVEGTAYYSGANLNGNPPSHTASWGAADNLWFTYCSGSTNITLTPSGWDSNLTSAYSAGVYGDLTVTTKNSAVATEDPPEGFTASGTAQPVGTFVVRPASSGGGSAIPVITSNLFSQMRG